MSAGAAAAMNPAGAVRGPAGPPRPAAMIAVAALVLGSVACSPSELPGQRSGQRLLVIALDGADWDRVEPMMAQGRLPHLAGLTRRGAAGQVAWERPPLSPLLWTTLATGRPPDEHGILDFVEIDPVAGVVPITGRSRRVKALWNMAEDAGLTAVTVGWWATWPAETGRGAMVSDRWSYTLLPLPGRLAAAGTVAPPEREPEMMSLKVEPEALGARDMLRFLPMDSELEDLLSGGQSVFQDGVEHPVAHLRRIVAATLSVEAAAESLLRRFSPDLAMVYFQGIDEVGHRFARYEAPALPGVSPAEMARYGGVVDAFYRFQDEVVGRLVAKAGPDTAVVLVSDHGFARGAERPPDEPADLTGKAALWHVGPGLIVMSGGSFGTGSLGEVRLVDVAPTLLVALGLPVAEDMAGGPLRAAFTGPFLDGHPPAVIASWERVGGPVRRLEPDEAVGGADARAQLERLRTLGYLDAAAPGAEAASDGLTPAAHLNLATVLAGRGATYEAEQAYAAAIAADPGSVPARRGLFDLLLAGGRVDEALAAGRDLLTMGRGVSPESWVSVARLWADSGRAAEGRAWLAGGERATGVGPLLAASLLADAEGDGEAARSALDAAFEADPASWDVAELIFRFHERQGDLQTAVPALRQGLAARGGDSLPHLIALGYIALDSGDLDAAGDYLGRAMEMAPDQEEVLLYMGSVHFRSGRYREAARIWARLVQQAPNHVDGRANLILALARIGRVAQALEAFRAAGPAGRDSVRLLNAAAHACLLNNLGREGLPLAERSLQLDPARQETRELVEALRAQAAREEP